MIIEIKKRLLYYKNINYKELKRGEIMLKNILDNHIQIIENVSSWEEAVYISGKTLIEKNKIDIKYLDEVIKNIKEIGPYVVLTEDIAMPHARPNGYVYESSLALLKVNSGIKILGSNENVRLIFLLAAKDNNSHIEIIQELTTLFNDEEKIKSILNCKSVEEIKKII